VKTKKQKKGKDRESESVKGSRENKNVVIIVIFSHMCIICINVYYQAGGGNVFVLITASFCSRL
jgi:hypothetical protein